MPARCGTEKSKTDKLSNRNLKRKPGGRGRKRNRKAEGVEVATVRRDGGRRKELQEAEYRNRKEGMETGFRGRGKQRGWKEPECTERTAARGDR